LSETFRIVRTERDMILMYIGLHVKYRLLLADCNGIEFSRQILEKYPRPDFIKIS